MLTIKQCFICESFDLPVELLNEIEMAGVLTKKELCLCAECRKKIMDLLNGRQPQADRSESLATDKFRTDCRKMAVEILKEEYKHIRQHMQEKGKAPKFYKEMDDISWAIEMGINALESSK